jgi:hypothetical protein
MKKLKIAALATAAAVVSALPAAVRADDIVSIKSAQANMVFTAPGTAVDFKITLAGTFALTNTYGGSPALLPQLRMVVNGDAAWASIYSLSQYKLGGLFDRTDVLFRYTVQPGDMAQPLRIYGGLIAPYEFLWNGWEVRSTATGQAAVWVFDPMRWQPALGEVYDIDLSRPKITLRTLAFDPVYTPSLLAVQESNQGRVSSPSPVGTAAVDVVVWTSGTNVLQVGSSPSGTVQQVTLASGSTAASFQLKGLSVGAADIYLQRPADYLSNTTAGVTNYIKRSITITDPPPASVQVVLLATGTNEATFAETDEADTGAFRLELSEAFSNDVWVRIDTSPAGQSNITFSATPYSLCVPAGSLTSPAGSFSVADGTTPCVRDGVRLIPIVTSPDASNCYMRIQAATVRVQNVRPALLQPEAAATFFAYRGQPLSLQWSVSDVAADLATGMEVTWQFGDGSADEIVTGATGTVTHAFTSVGEKAVRVIARDNDGGESDEIWLTVSVEEMPVPPHIRVVSSRLFYGETSSANTGDLRVYLSEPYFANVWVRLTTEPLSQSNLVFASSNAIMIAAGMTNSAACLFSLRDGTPASECFGITVTPVITNSPANAYFTDVRSETIFITNSPPRVTSPSAQELQVPVFSPLSVTYAVDDVNADRSTMTVRWNFGDGVTLTVTGAVGSVTHTYASLGSKAAWVEAEDKDGGISARVQFAVTVAVPSVPTLRVDGPVAPVQETMLYNRSSLTVNLSEPFSNAVNVALQVAPVTNAVNGSLLLSNNLVLFAPGETQKVVRFSARDGTDLSLYEGFTVAPSIVGPMSAVAFYTTIVAGVVTLQNVPPVISTPVASDLSGRQLYTLIQGAPFTFTWSLSDVVADRSSLQLTWYFGDGGSLSVTGATGVCTHAYLASGDYIVTAVALDKDGGYSDVRFKVRVVAASGFTQWAAERGLSGYPYDLFALDRNGDGVANGFEYAFGYNLTNGVPLLKIRLVDGAPVIETPARAPGTTGDAVLTVQASTNLLSNQWDVPMGPANAYEKPIGKDWYMPLVPLADRAFFRLQIRLE